MKTTLTIEESARLIELGVDAKLASNYEFANEILGYEDGKIKIDGSKLPIFTLTDLLSILPKEIDGNILLINATGFNIDTEELEEGWCVFYIDSKCNVAYGEKSIFSAPELIDALYQLLIWCLEQGYCKCGKGCER